MNPDHIRQPNFDPSDLPPGYLDELKKRLQREQAQAMPQGRELSKEEQQHMQKGFAVEEMTKTAGWQTVVEVLSALPKAHVDPRGKTREEWMFAEEQAFWQGAVASELVETLQKIIQDAHELQAMQTGESKGAQRPRY